MKKVMSSPLGSFLKAFLVAFLTILVSKYNEGVTCTNVECLKSVAIAALFSIIPVIINYLNPEYKGYGKGAE